MLTGSSKFLESFSQFLIDYEKSVMSLVEEYKIPGTQPSTDVNNRILFSQRIQSLNKQAGDFEKDTTGPLSMHELTECAEPFIQHLEKALTITKDIMN